MKVKTTRFGDIEVDELRIMDFDKGILGFPEDPKFVLLQTNEEGNFFWLQSISRPDLAFVVSDPLLFEPNYQVPIKEDDFKEIGMENMADAQVLIIINKIDRMLTGNMQGPLVINARNCQGRQLVLSEKKYKTRHPLVNLDVSPELKVSRTA